MRRKLYQLVLLFITLLMVAESVSAQTAAKSEATKPAAKADAKVSNAGTGLSKDQPIEITADALDVHQDEHKAIFTGNVIAVQGTSSLRSKVMTAFYNQENKPKPGAAAAAKPAGQQDAPPGISSIEADENVVFTTPQETATGDKGVYTAADDTIVLTGSTVTLTRDQNVLKGQKLVYNMGTGRSVLTSTGGVQVDGVTVGKPGRVHGLFVPKSDVKSDPKSDKKVQ